MVNFPFTDFDGSKFRPAVVLIPENKFGDTCLCFITSRIIDSEDSIMISEKDKDFRKTGLKVGSAVRVGKIVALEKKMIAGKIGSLSGSHIKSIDKILKKIFQL